MKGSNKSRWAAVLVVAIVAGAAYWLWQGREAANSGAPTASGARQQGPGGRTPRSFWRRPRAGTGGHRHQRSGTPLPFRPRHRDGGEYRHRPQPRRRPAAGRPHLPGRPAGQSGRSARRKSTPASSKLPSPRPRASWPKIGPPSPTPAAIWRATSSWSKTNLVSRQELDAQQSLLASETQGTIKADEASRRQRPAAARLEPHHRASRRPRRSQSRWMSATRSPAATPPGLWCSPRPTLSTWSLPCRKADIATVVQAQKARKTAGWSKPGTAPIRQKISEGSLRRASITRSTPPPAPSKAESALY